MIKTDRLIVRKAIDTDITDVAEMRNSEFVLKYNGMAKLNLDQLKEMIVEDSQNEYAFYIVEPIENKVIGSIYLNPDRLRHKVDSLCLSYYMNEKYAGKGYMSEALNAVIDYIFSQTAIEIISARVFKENKDSAKLLERLNFTYEGCIRKCVKGYNDIVYDDLLFSLFKEER